MSLPTTLSNAALDILDRLTAVLMTLVDAISPIALTGSTPTFPDEAAKALFFRLARIVATLIRFSNVGIRAPAKPAAAPEAGAHPADIERSGPGPIPAQHLPGHPGWLLDALPEIAPAIASDLAALLADPVFASILAAAPTLHRALKPILRSLGLTRPPPLPDAPPPRPRPCRPTPLAPPRSPQPPRPNPPFTQPLRIHPTGQHLPTSISLRINNNYGGPQAELLQPIEAAPATGRAPPGSSPAAAPPR